MGAPTGTVFDNPYFALERPAFRKIAAFSDHTLTVALVVIAALVFLAAFRFTPTQKAVLLAWLTLP